MAAEFHASSCPGSPAGDDGPLGRSVMKWGADGELSALDLQQILARLSCSDDQAAGMMRCRMDQL